MKTLPDVKWGVIRRKQTPTGTPVGLCIGSQYMLEGKLQYRICTEKKKSRELLWEYCRQLLPCRLFSPSRRFRDCKSDNRHWPHAPTGPRRLRTDTTRTNSKNASNSYTRNKLLQTQRKQVYVGEPEKKKRPLGQTRDKLFETTTQTANWWTAPGKQALQQSPVRPSRPPSG